MKILIIGGTRFLGRHLVNSARSRGHIVTLFNRGQSNPNLFLQVDKIHGDREKDLDKLMDQHWDAVIDTCGYFPRIVRMSAEALKDKVDKYVFISSISVYSDFKKIGINENDAVGKIENESIEEITDASYGPLKALCEKAVQDVFGIYSLIIRPGLIVGPHDPTDRFTYWPVRVARGGNVLAPDSPSVPTQIIDVRDLSKFIIELIEQNVSGVFNATGPDYELSFGRLLDTCKLIGNSNAKFKWTSLDFLNQNNVAPWSDLPAWVPDNGDDAGFAHVDVSKAIRAGLTFLSLEETVHDTLEWANSRPADHKWKAGLSEEREKELLIVFNKILIANRGEIAIRIMRACKELGIKTVAVYSEADKNSLHLQFADEAIFIGDALPKESYLNIDKLIKAATQTGAGAIHPGYGFLSENASFAAAVESAKLTFIGPSADSILAMGDKAQSKILMKKAGVPTVPGFEGLESEKDFKKAAKEIGYPVLIKASAGGGGKGMKVVNQESEIGEAIESAKREALNSFGDERLLIEKYLADAHHIEFQVFGDKHGNLIHLFERECSVQRRHQKIIEETPSLLLTPKIREEMGQAAVAAAKAVNYFNAGTIEFIFAPTTSQYYFLEMNTRLQVEHPVTELVAGIDLVQWQIKITAGEKFPFKQSDFMQRGHAIECRVYAEDPANGFLPSTGKLLQFIEPHGPGIRVDSGFTKDDEVTHFYDPLLAKLIVHAENRDVAIQKMQTALKDFIVHGVVTNIDFMQAVLEHDDFAKGKVTTRWVEKTLESGSLLPDVRQQAVGLQSLIAAALADLTIVNQKSKMENGIDPFSPWKNPSGFRI